MHQLHIAADLRLPVEAVTQTFAILAKRGVGKTYTSAVMTEELLKAGLHVVIADPIGVWWGLRASSDGKREGLPIIVLGGDRGDVPLEVTAGETIADLIVDERLPAVLDLSRFRKGEQTRFMTDFCERLYHRNRAPLHLVLDEADAFAPQRPMKGQERLLGAVEDLVRRGRARGIGVTLVTQRSAVLNKDVLTQVEVLVALRTIAPQDRSAIDEWIKVHGTPAQREELMQSLPSLPVGTAWFWSPGWLDVFQKVKVRTRETFDSSATPQVGKQLQSPKKLAEVDLSKLKERISATIERAKAEDPRALRQRITELEQKLQTELKETDHQECSRALAEVHRQAEQQFKTLEANYKQTIAQLINRLEKIAALAAAAETAPPVTALRPYAEARQPQPPVVPKRSFQAVAQVANDENLAGGERKLLTALAQYSKGRSKTQLAIMTGYSHRGGGFNNYLSALRSKGYITGSTEHIKITADGLEALGSYEPLPTGQKLIDHWRDQLSKAERAILDALIAAYPDSLFKETVATQTGYEANGGGFNNALSKLRTLELIEGRGDLKAADTFFEN